MFTTMALSRLSKENRRPLPLLTLSPARNRSVWCLWLCVPVLCCKILNTSDLPKGQPLVMLAFRRQSFCLVIFL